MERIFLEELVPIGLIDDKDLFFVLEKDAKEGEDPIFCLRVWCDGSMSYGFGILQKFAKFLPITEIDFGKDLLREYYQNRISKTFNGDSIYQMMSDFQEEYNKMNSLDNKWLYNFTQVKTLNVNY